MDHTARPPGAPAVSGIARVGRRATSVLDRLQPGDVAVIDQADLDRATAQGLIDAGVGAVVNASAMMSGRYPSTGPQLLLEAGVPVVDGVGTGGTEAIRDARTIRVVGDAVLVGEVEVARGREVTLTELREQAGLARRGLLAQLDTLTANAGEFLRREQELVLDGVGLPDLTTEMRGRPVVVVARAGDHEAELSGVLRWIREENPVLIAVDKAVDDVRDAGLAPHVAIISSSEPSSMPSLESLRSADDVVVRLERGGRPSILDTLGKLGTVPLRCETSATSEDLALLVADAGHASLVVGVGVHADLAELLDRRRAGLASTYLTRLKLGSTLVDASAVPLLYTGRVQTWHVVLVLLAGWLALAVAIAVTPVGQGWLDHLPGLPGVIIAPLQGPLR